MMRFIKHFKEKIYKVNLKQNCKIKLCNINKDTSLIDNCILSNVVRTEVFDPKYSYNECAVNDYKVLLIGDSFLSEPSKLFRATFKHVWQIFYHDFNGKKLEEYIKKIKPDIVIYQTMEWNFQELDTKF